MKPDELREKAKEFAELNSNFDPTSGEFENEVDMLVNFTISLKIEKFENKIINKNI